jgi:hypothetical protein
MPSWEIPLPCPSWKALGTENNPTGFKYRAGSREHGPCKSIQVRDGKRLKSR